MKKALFAFLLVAVCTAGMAVASSHGSGAELYDKKCAKCHGKDGAKVSGASGGVALKGQSEGEIAKKLMGYLDGSYGGKKKKTMQRMLKKFSPEEIQGLAHYIGSL